MRYYNRLVEEINEILDGLGSRGESWPKFQHYDWNKGDRETP